MNDSPSLIAGVVVQVDPALGLVDVVAEGDFRIVLRRPANYRVCNAGCSEVGSAPHRELDGVATHDR